MGFFTRFDFTLLRIASSQVIVHFPDERRNQKQERMSSNPRKRSLHRAPLGNSRTFQSRRYVVIRLPFYRLIVGLWIVPVKLIHLIESLKLIAALYPFKQKKGSKKSSVLKRHTVGTILRIMLTN